MKVWTQVLKTALLCGSALGAAGFGGAAMAQAANEPSQATAVDEIIVTAQRRAERVEDIPMVVASVSAEDISSRGLSNLHDLGQAVTGVQINMGGSFTQTAVRGVGTLTTGVGTENNVSLYIDGYYQPDTASLGADFANLSGVEVLKGPQGTLWGRNATGGAILMNTLTPSEVLTGKLEAKIGNFNDRSYSGYISGPFSERVRYSVAAYGRNTDGYYKTLDQNLNVVGNAAPIRAISVRSKLEVDVTEDLNVVFGANFTDYSDPRGSMFVVERYPLSVALPPATQRATAPRTWTGNRETEQQTLVKELTATTTWASRFGKLTSYTGYAKREIDASFDFDASFADISFSDTQYTEESYQEAVDFTFERMGNLELTIGGTYWNDTVESYSQNFGNNARIQLGLSETHVEAWAAFFDANYHFTDKLTLNVGGRYTTEERINSTIQYLGATTAVLAGAPVKDFTVDFQNFSPRVSVRYELADRTNVYASYSRGFRSGSNQILYVAGAPVIAPIEPEEITAYEVGFKTAQPWGQFEAAAFHYDYTNIQVGTTIINPTCGLTCAPINAIANGKEATINGVEASASFSLFDNLHVEVGGSYLKAEYSDFARATGNGLNPVTQTNVSSQIQNWGGQQMARAPEFSGMVNLRYEIQDVVGGMLTPSVNFKYTDSYVLNNASLYGPVAGAALADKQRYREGAYGLVNAALTWESNGGYTAALFVNNLTGVDYHLNQSGSAFGDYGTWAWPRQYGVRLGYKF